jgi:multidrug resistance protein
MVAAPFVGPLADRYSRKLIIILGAVFWSGLTLMTAVTHTYGELLLRHTLVGVGEATFVTIAPTFVADLFPENKRGRIFGIFYLAIPCGTAAGYLLGGWLGPTHGWRFPFYVAAFPGFLLALAVSFLPEPPRGQFDSLKETPERGTLRGLARNPAFWMVTLGMAAGTFSLGGIQVWMPTFLSRSRGYSLEAANLIFGKIVVVADERFVLLRFRSQHGPGCAGDVLRFVQPGAVDGARYRRGGVSAFVKYLAPQHRTRQLGRFPHSRHRHRSQHFPVSSSGRCSFTNPHGICR